MAWVLLYQPAAEKELSKLDRSIQKAVKKYLHSVCQLEDPTARGHPLSGPLAGLHRYRLGQLRIIVAIERNIITVTVLSVDKRDNVYG